MRLNGGRKDNVREKRKLREEKRSKRKRKEKAMGQGGGRKRKYVRGKKLGEVKRGENDGIKKKEEKEKTEEEKTSYLKRKKGWIIGVGKVMKRMKKRKIEVIINKGKRKEGWIKRGLE